MIANIKSSTVMIALAVIITIPLSTLAYDDSEFDFNTIGMSLEEQFGLERSAAEKQFMPTFEEIDRWEREAQARQLKDERDNGKVVVIDTRDKKVCSDLKNYLMAQGVSKTQEGSVEGLCNQSSSKSPYITLMAIDQKQEVDLEAMRAKIEARQQYGRIENSGLVKDTINMIHLGGAALSLLYAAPQEYTNWSDEKRTTDDLDEKISNNIKAGPVVDKDNFLVNYLGHPLSGAWYYLIARNNDVGPWNSFGYSVLMSTFYWEYGLEAFFEEPSLQDLIITPVIGSIMGEVFYQAINGIKNNDGELLGSKALGTTAMVVMNPLEGALNHVNSLSELFKENNLRGSWMAVPTADLYHDRNPEIDTIEDLQRGRGEYGGRDFMIGFFVQGVF
jgi:hypothetical protein